MRERDTSGEREKDRNGRPRFTVITPTWDQAEFIRETMESVLTQSFRDLEYIIVDNLSDDGTEDIVREYEKKDDRVIYIRESDHGQAEAINKGLKRAKGEIVCWLNSDDTYTDPEVLKRVDRAFLGSPETGIVIGDAWYSDRDGNRTEYNPSDRKVPAWVLHRWYYIVQPAIFWKNEGRLLDESYHYAFDWKFFIGETGKQKLLYTHDAYAVYRMYEDNKTGQDNAKRKAEVLRLQEELGESRLNIAWCRHVYHVYLKSEKLGRPKMKKRIDLIGRILFHITGKRIVCF